MAVEAPRSYRRYRRYFVDINRLYRKKKVRVYTGIVLSILTVSFFLFFAIRPTLVTIASLLKEIEDKEVILDKLEDKVNALHAAQAEYQRVGESLHFVDEALPTDPNLSLFVRELEALARSKNVALDSLQINPTLIKGENLREKETNNEIDEVEGEKKVTSIEGVDFNLVVAGDYNQLKSFFDDLIRLRRLVFVEAFTFRTGREEEGLFLNVEAKASYLRPALSVSPTAEKK